MSLQLPKVLIVGAGPVGMAGALELNRLGMNVRIVDRNTQRSQLSKAVGINARTLELLESSGVSQQLVAKGLRIPRIHLRHGERVLTTVDFSRMNHRYNFMLSLPQDETEEILERSLQDQGVVVERGIEFTRLRNFDDHISAELKRGDVVSCYSTDYILGSDGAHSSVRKQVALEFSGKPYEDLWSLADVRMDWRYGHGEGNLIMLNGGKVLFVLSMPDARYRVISNSRDALELLPAGSKVKEVLWQTNFNVSLRQVATYQKGNVFLAGDAAHIHSPAGGRGMNLGIEDAMVFARRLVSGDLLSYSRERHAVGLQVIRESNMQFRMAAASNPVVKVFRNFMLGKVLGSEVVQREFRRRMAGIDHAVTELNRSEEFHVAK